MLKTGGIYSLNSSNLFCVILDKSPNVYFGFCFFSIPSNNEELNVIISEKIKKYKPKYDKKICYYYWVYENIPDFEKKVTGYIGNVSKEILDYGRKVLSVISIEHFTIVFDYFLKKCRCNSCKYLIETTDYTGKEPYYYCGKNKELNGYMDEMVEIVCENFEI